ncbi:MAG: ATP-dependent helicase [Actinobacteria bacterium]|uniref:Unannotated protein n=1 Tax=freshwater metagenome TaxID=449393 RepID=A0A6J6Q2Q8_9ZZZZ|nr:ATP-dependent helicase [Actinomycetota bacterium]MSZ04073.1 ATP-dependent helicase [Actinomycetota bacterium]MTB05913.1 ATP-dependent helicase [Actinomycetota bacterium]
MNRWSRADVHATWHGDEVCLWAWANGPAQTAPLNALYSDVYAGKPSGRVGFVTVDVPGRGPTKVPCMHWPVRAAVESLVGRPCSPSWSASLAWFHRVVQLAGLLAGTRHVVPAVSGAAADAVWTVVRDEATDAAIERLARSMPPVVAAAGAVDVVALVEECAAAAARGGLRLSRWKPSGAVPRDAVQRTVRTVFRHLSDDPNVPLSQMDPVGVVDDLGRWFRFERARLVGERVIRPRLRMTPPVDADGDWRFELELVDANDSLRWCTAQELVADLPGAAAVAEGARARQLVDGVLRTAATTLATRVPPLGRLEDAPGEGAALALDEVGVVLGLAERIHEAGIELLGPEQLLRSSVRLTARATPSPEGGVRGGLNAKALVAWGASIEDQDVDPEELARASAAGAALVQVGGRWVRLDRPQVRRVLDALDRHRRQHEEVDAATLMRLAAEQGDNDVEFAVESEGWAADLLAGLPDEHLQEVVESDGFVGTLRHYQRRGLAWLGFHARLGLGGVLADDMGLGKTATTLAHLLDRPGPHLVVCPLSVVRNWETESARFTPSLSVHVHHGGDRVQGDDAAALLGSFDIVITTYGLLSRSTEVLEQVPWTTVVLDEAQAVKNPHTKAARAVRRLPAAQRLALTGTPMENRLSELWSILDAVNPGLLGSLSRFQGEFATPIEKDRSTEAAERLRRLTAPFLLRRTKADKTLLPDLPDKVEQIAWATLTREQATMYQSVVDELLKNAEQQSGMRRRGLVLASLTRLKQICNHPAHALGDGSRLTGRSGKLARFDELVEELMDAGERALVFTQYREMGDLLQRHLADKPGIEAPFLHGGVARRQRDAMVERFQDGLGAPLLLVSLKAGGTGLNLTAASRVIHYDRWWNPAVEDQATDRAWRIGQERTVFVHKLVCTGTLEERIGQLIDEKRALASAVVGTTGEAWLSELSTDQLRDLVMLDRGVVE